MQNWKIQSMNLNMILISDGIKIFKWPRLRWFYCFYIYYKKESRKEGGREAGNWLILVYKASSCQQESYFSWLQDTRMATYTFKKYIYIFPSKFHSVENFSLWSIREPLENCCSRVPSDSRAHSLFALSQSYQGGCAHAETNRWTQGGSDCTRRPE